MTTAPPILNKEAIAARMFRHAARHWGYADSNVEQFDPLVRLLIEACAVELFRIGNEIASVEERMLEKLAQLLTPEAHTGPRPAHAILHARPYEPVGFAYPGMQFIHQRRQAAKSGSSNPEPPLECFFSPAGRYMLFNADVSAIALGRNLYSISNDHVRELVLSLPPGRRIDARTLWLGLEVDKSVKEMEGLRFFLDLPSHPDRRRLVKRLRYTRWSLQDNPLHMVAGGRDASKRETISEAVYDLEEFDINHNLINAVEGFYEDHFLTIGQHPQGLVRPERCPSALEAILSASDLSRLQQPLVWLKVEFPPDFDEQALDELTLHANAFPVINRRLNEIRYRVQSTFNIVPLLCTEQFLSLHRVQGSEGADDADANYVSTPFDDRELRHRGSYTLRTGAVERFDSRDAVEYLNFLLELLRDESRAFAALGQDFVATLVKDLNQNIARLEQKVKQNISLLNQAPVFLAINPRTEGDNVFIEFWSTNGEAANGIRSATRLDLYQGSEIDPSSLLLLTGTGGGRDKLKNTEILNVYQSILMTRGRLVTMEDVRHFCAMELAEKAHSIDVRKGVGIGTRPTDGLVHTIEVHINPNPDSGAPDDWTHRMQDLESRLARHSAAWVNYRLSVNAN